MNIMILLPGCIQHLLYDSAQAEEWMKPSVEK